MKYIFFTILLFGYLQAGAQTKTTVSREKDLEMFINRLKQELDLTVQQEQKITALRREEIKILDSVQLVQQTTGKKFNIRSFIKDYDNRMKAVLTPEQLNKLDTLNRQRKEAVEQRLKRG